MRALVLSELKTPLQLVDRADLQPGPGQAVVAIKAAALNRRDYWITQGMYPGIKLPGILGSDGAGTVARAGDNVDNKLIDQPVIINPGWEWGESQAAQGAEFRILGMPDDGTFATQVLVPAEYLHAKPQHLDWRQAAALSLAGVTAFRAVFSQGNLQAGENMLITGIGGGVATLALQFAVAAGANVVVTSSSEAKIEKAIQLGAKEGFDYKQEAWHRRAIAAHGPMDLIVDGAGGNGYGDLLELAAPAGRIVNYGATAGPPPKLDLFKLFWKQLRLVGSTMGSVADFAAMLHFVDAHQLAPVIDTAYPLADGNAALERMKGTKHFGKIVLDVAE